MYGIMIENLISSTFKIERSLEHLRDDTQWLRGNRLRFLIFVLSDVFLEPDEIGSNIQEYKSVAVQYMFLI
jgi:hypothetical protein